MVTTNLLSEKSIMSGRIPIWTKLKKKKKNYTWALEKVARRYTKLFIVLTEVISEWYNY